MDNTPGFDELTKRAAKLKIKEYEKMGPIIKTLEEVIKKLENFDCNVAADDLETRLARLKSRGGRYRKKFTKKHTRKYKKRRTYRK